MDLIEKTLSSKEVYKGKVITLKVDEVELPNGKNAIREVAHHAGAVAILPITKENEVLMVRQYRYAYQEILLEIPAGKIDAGEQPLAAAVRELSEEVNCKSNELVSLGYMYPAPGAQNEKVYLYYAKDLNPSNGALDEDEFLEVVRYPFDQVVEMILNHEIKDAKTIATVLKYKLLSEK